ncbi:MAG: HDIG domain-containing protein [Candidatus Omnitrophica bacterium]|nr:HDIG domain-containing protein [Candidatus Omnitrophota bacterium]
MKNLKLKARKQRYTILAIFTAGWILMTLLLAFERSPHFGANEFIIGEPAPRTLFSPLNITYVNEKATGNSREQKAREVLPVLSFDPKISQEASAKVNHLFETIHESQKGAPREKKIDRQKLPFETSEVTLQWLFARADQEEILKDIQILMEQYFSQGIMSGAKKQEILAAGTNNVQQISPDGKEEKTRAVKEIMTLTEAREASARALPESAVKNRDLKNAVLEILNAGLAANLFVNEEETKARRKKAADAVPPVEEQIKKDELIVQRGILITPQGKNRLDQVQKKMTQRRIVNKLSAVGILTGVSYFLCLLYLYFFDRKTLRSPRLTILVHVIFLVGALACKVIILWPGAHAYVMPGALASLLLALLIHARLAMMGAAVSAVLVAPISGFQPEIMLAVLLSSIAGTHVAFQIRKRVQFIKAGAVVGLACFSVYFAMLIFHEYTAAEALQESIWGLGSGFLVTTLCFLLLPLFEWVFNLTTDVTLLELSDLNHPLLKRMIVEAPGTYHHSLVVSTLAESACETIGANSLLARVGAYFHDIGKIARSEFFTENQPTPEANKHEKLTPNTSFLIISNHVKDGIELGREHKLKDRILQFIPEHQGTGVVYYFYRKAMDQARPGEKVNPEDYRYPGPKPQSRETAVVMLADSTEAASRSLKQPTPENIRQLVRKIINDKFIDGQLEECDLTLRDLHRIQESFVHNLMAIFHTRVSYPAAEEAPDRPDLFRKDSLSKLHHPNS